MKILLILLLGIIIGWSAHTLFITTQNFTHTIQRHTIQTSKPQDAQTHLTTPNSTQNKDTTDSQETQKIDIFSPQYLITQAQQLIQQQEYEKALQPLTEVLSQVQNEYNEAELQKIFIATLKNALSLQQSIIDKTTILYDAINTLPDNLELRFLLAQYLIDAGHYEDATYQLSFLQYHPRWMDKFNTLTEQINYATLFTRGEIHIPLIKEDRAWHIQGVVNGKKITLVLDTGATQTTIANKFLTQDISRSIVVSTANGEISAHIHKNNTLKINKINKTNIGIIGLPSSKLPKGIDGLLGMDILGEFNFIIDGKNHMLRLTPKNF
jgi:clan AA aspartic protease (TIGR02281 family)